MDTRPGLPLGESLSAAFDWWRDAGVDCDFSDEPSSWLAQEEPAADAPEPAVLPATRPSAAPAPAPLRLGGDPAQWPQDLEGFRRWWTSDLDLGGGGRRVAPSGAAGAELMVLVPMPGAGDEETLLGGAEGKLVRAFAAAAGIAAERLYLASALPGHWAMPDWRGLDEAGLGEIVRHHCRLVAPARLLVLGRDVLPLLGHDPAQGVSETGVLQGTPPIGWLAGYAPQRLLENARLRERLWHKWLDWTGTG